MTQYGPRQAAGVTEGQILAGKYRVERVLGVGGMGVVVAAHHIGLDDKVAIKFLLPEMLSNAEAVSRFAREARNAVKIKGEHMARVFDVGTLETGAPYMVMEFLEGGDLHSWLEQRGPLEFEEAVDFVLQACEAIAEAHVLGIVHRDLKPANLFCVRRADGRLSIKVLDFGISKVTPLGGSPRELRMTSTASLMGSPFYMSPEQLEASHSVDARSDIWALGVIVHELVAGKVPFPGATLPEVSIRIHSRPPLLLRDSRRDAPEGLQAVVLRCLEKDRERRYRNVAELALALLPFGSKRAKASVERITDIIQTAGLTAKGLSVPPSSEPRSQPVATETIAPFGRTAGAGGGKRTIVGIVAATGALALAAVMVFARVPKMRSATETEPPATSRNAAAALPQPVLPQLATTQTAPPVEPRPSASPVNEPPRPPSNHGSTPPAHKPAPPAMASPKPEGTAAATTTTSATPVPLSSGQAWTGLAHPTTTTPSPPPTKPSASPADVPAAANPDCNPPWVIVAGYRQYKTECLHPSERQP